MYGPVGSAEVTLADPLTGGGRTFPSVLLAFGTLVLRVGWHNHEAVLPPDPYYFTTSAPDQFGDLWTIQTMSGADAQAGALADPSGNNTTSESATFGFRLEAAGPWRQLSASYEIRNVSGGILANGAMAEWQVKTSEFGPFWYASGGIVPSDVSRVIISLNGVVVIDHSPETANPNAEGDLVAQLIDVSTGTPVVVQRLAKPMRPFYGYFPGDGFRLKGVKLDATRALVTWDFGYIQPVVVVSVSGGLLSIGNPVNVGGDITLEYDDGRPRFDSNSGLSGGTGILHDTVLGEDLVGLEGGQAGFISLARVYHVDGDFTTWKETRMGCLISTSGLIVTSFKWWYLDSGYVRFSYPSHGDSFNAAMGAGGLALLIVGTVQPTSDFNSRQAVLYRVDFTGADNLNPPNLEQRTLPRRPFDGATTDGEYFVLTDSTGYMMVPLANPILGTLEQAAGSQTDGTYLTPVGASYQHYIEPTPTPRGWLALNYQSADLKFNELRRVGAGAVETTGAFVVLDRTLPEPQSDIGGSTAVMAGTRYAVALVDFELLDSPTFNYREFMYVYEPIRQGEIQNGRRRGSFLQIRAGNS